MDDRTGMIRAGATPGLAGMDGAGPGGLRPGPSVARSAPVRGTRGGGGVRRPGQGTWPLFSGLGPVAALPTAPGLARAFTVMVLSGWDMAAMTDTGALIVSEFAGNVVLAARGPSHGDAGRLPVLWLRLLSDGGRLQVEVWDDIPMARGVPALRHADPDEESGRGLELVDAVSLDWGWEHRPGEGFKRVWALLGT
jgi:hypothetical protein